MNEVWKAIVGYEGIYEVSNLGRVRAIGIEYVMKCRWGGTMLRKSKARILLATGNKNGYPSVTLVKDAIHWSSTVGKLVLTAFVGPRPPDHHICHFPNADVFDNRLCNLRWGTVRENHHDMDLHGTRPRGERHGNAKLTDLLVLKAIEMKKLGYTSYEIAKDFGIGQSAIHNALVGNTWKHVHEAHLSATGT